MNDQRSTTHGGGAYSSGGSDSDITRLILSARDAVIDNPNISHGAARMFVKILDLSVRMGSKGIDQPPGVVTVSQTKLHMWFKVALRTIWNWKAELVNAGAIWMTSQPMPNAWPIDTYHISLLHPPRHSGDKTTAEGLWGNGARQRRPETIGFGARTPGGNPAAGPTSNQLRVATGFRTPEKSSILPENAGHHRNPLPASVATGCGGEPQPVATGGRNQLRRATETSCYGAPQPVAAGGRNQLPRATATKCEHIEAKVTGSSQLSGGSGAIPLPDLEVQEAIKDGDTAFADWCDSLRLRTASNPDGEYRGKLVKELGRCKVKLQTQPSDFWRRRANWLQTQLDGGKPPVAKPGPARVAKPSPAKARLTDEQRDALAQNIGKAMRQAVAAAR